MLASLLNDQISTTAQLLELLRKEYAIMKAHNLVELEQVVADKQSCVTRLLGLTKQWTYHLEREGYSTDATGMETCIARYAFSERSELETAWAALQKTMAQAQQQNAINGAVIASSRSHTELALAILWGRNPQGCLYNHGAQTTFSSSLNPLGKA